MSKPICIVAGLGNATGTGASVARLWASRGFRVALVSRPRKDVDDLCESIVATGADVGPAIELRVVRPGDLGLSIAFH